MTIWSNPGKIALNFICYLIIALAIIFIYIYKKKHPKFNTKYPFVFIVIFLLIGDNVFKQLYFINSHWTIGKLPFDICGSIMLWSALAIFCKKNSFGFRIGNTMTCVTSFGISVVEIVDPDSIYNGLNGTIFASYDNFWAVTYHMCVLFICVYLLCFPQYKPKFKDFLWCLLFGAIFLVFVAGFDTLFDQTSVFFATNGGFMITYFNQYIGSALFYVLCTVSILVAWSVAACFWYIIEYCVIPWCIKLFNRHKIKTNKNNNKV